jgi:beta-glucanase (GH16 family)
MDCVAVSRRLGVALACVTIALGLVSSAVVPALAGAGGPAHAQAAKKKKCKKRKKARAAKHKKKKCKRPKRQGNTTAPTSPSPGPGERSGGPAPPPAPGECGVAIPKGDGSYWDCTFADNFNGDSLNLNKWLPQRTAETGYLNGPDACFIDSPNNVSESNGTLKLTAREESSAFDCVGGLETRYTTGMVSTSQGRFSQTYGRFEIRAKISDPQVQGLQSSLWLWPDDSSRYGAYPASGEIDIAEMFSQYPNRAIPYIHYNPLLGVDPLQTNEFCLVSNLDQFHTYTLVWTPDSLTISYDGVPCLVDYWIPASPQTKPQPFDQPFFIALTQALGVGTNEFDPDSTPLPATTEVDYVHVWK